MNPPPPFNFEKMIEQVREFHETYGCGIDKDTFDTFRGDLQIEEAEELKEAIKNEDMVEIADAVGDSLYLAIGTAIYFGFEDKLKEIMDAIHESNMSKLDPVIGKPIIREDGKVLKGPNYKPPTEDIKRILNS